MDAKEISVEIRIKTIEAAQEECEKVAGLLGHISVWTPIYIIKSPFVLETGKFAIL